MSNDLTSAAAESALIGCGLGIKRIAQGRDIGLVVGHGGNWMR